MLIIAYIVLGFTVIQLLVALANLVFETTLPESTDAPDDRVSVLVPARNEEKNIGNILDDLINQACRNIEVIVFNDQSEDRTAEIVTEYTISESRIRLVNSGGLPEGWLGKNFACHSLSEKATGKYYLFLDADVRIGKDLIGRAVSFSIRYDIDLISIFPKQIIKSFGERITIPNMNYILVSLLPLVLVRKTEYPSLSAANGQFMFFRADTYHKMKPHETVKADKAEDISIARIYKENGKNIACLLGDDSITCRMYSGFRDAVTGFSKNVIAFFGNSFILALLFWFVTTFGFVAVLSEFSMPVIIAYFIMYLLTRFFISASSRQNIFYNLLFIIPLQVSMGLFIYKAFINKYYKKFRWKGRNID